MNQPFITKFKKQYNTDFAQFIKKLELQAIETAEERIPLYVKVNMKNAKRVLDIGCGSGIVTRDIAHMTRGQVYGIDESPDMIQVASEILQPYDNVQLQVSSGEKIPFYDNTFDITTCNLVLMWTLHPQQVVNEMARVTKQEGVVLASLEPDYGGKLHYPEDPKVDPIFAGKAIAEKGGDPHIGRKLRCLFTRAGLQTTVGIGNNRIWSCEEDRSYYQHARDFYIHALRQADISQQDIDNWEYAYLRSLDEGIQLNFFPQFYAIGKKQETK